MFSLVSQIVASQYHPNQLCFDCLTDLYHALKFFENARSAQHHLLLSAQSILISEEIKVEKDKLEVSSQVLKREDEEQDPNASSDVVVMEFLLKEEISEPEQDNSVIEEYLYEEHLSGDNTIVAVADDSTFLDDEEHINVVELHDNEEIKSIKEKKPSTLIKKARIKSESKGIKIYTCQICSKAYDKKTSYQYHVKTKHIDMDDRQFECTICSKKFAIKADLIRHSRIHTNEKRFICSYCGKKFTDRSTHLKHERVHSGVKPYQCDQCMKSFSYKFVLANHYLTHTGEKNFPCPECQKRFSRKSKMKDHFLRIHKKPFTQEDEQKSQLIQENHLRTIEKDINFMGTYENLSDKKNECIVVEINDQEEESEN